MSNFGAFVDSEFDPSRAMLRDQWRLRKRWRQIHSRIRRGIAKQDELLDCVAQLEASANLRSARKNSVPAIAVASELPIAEHADSIRQALATHQVVVVSGATGSGKSTQLPLLCLQLGLAEAGYIGHTQPRRIAARSVSARIAQQLRTTLGDLVGFKIRFSDQTAPHSLIKVMTDGILLAETQSDRWLNQYSAIIVDEAHERSLNVDFLLGYLKRLLPFRPELKLIITSATIDTEKFARHFEFANGTIGTDVTSTKTNETANETSAPVIDVPGRSYPVDVRYRPPGLDQEGNPTEEDLDGSIVAAVNELIAEDRTAGKPGDILLFLPTENDIRTVGKKIRGAFGDQLETLPLYARLTTAQQNVIFQPHRRRRIVLATNVAESSITVPGIRYVIDTGTARISRYAPRSKVQRLPIEAISQASANQRSGRCGRLGPGICIRLYDESDFLSRPKFTTPEIRRTNLASVILQAMALRLGDIEEFPFIDKPSSESIRDGYRTLFELGATDDKKRLTPLGRLLSRLPVDPRIGRMLVAADEYRCLADVLVIASALEIQDPRIRPYEKSAAADEAHARFKHEDSDFLSLIKLWDFLHELKENLATINFARLARRISSRTPCYVNGSTSIGS